MKKYRGQILIGVLGLAVFVLAIASIGGRNKSPHAINTTQTTVAVTTPSSDSENTGFFTGSSVPTTTTTVQSGPSELDDADPSQIKASYDAKPSPYDAATTNYLKQQSQSALFAYLVGQGRDKFPVLWPTDTSGSDANFKTAQINASYIASGDSDNAVVFVSWQSTDLKRTSYPHDAEIKAQKQNGAWQIVRVTS